VISELPEFGRVFRTLFRSALFPFIASSRTPKLFAIGFNKTGTTSLDEIFTDLGFHSYHGTAWRDTSRRMIFQHYDAFSDGPPDDFALLDQRFPGSKFILQTRNLDEWIDSRLEHIKRLPHLRGKGDDWVVSVEAIRAWVEKRNHHHLAVMRHFASRPQDLLVINYIRDPDAATRICSFLNKPISAQKPHSNSNPGANTQTSKVLKNPEMLAQAMADMAIPQTDWKNDLLCPSLLPAESRGQWPADTQDLGRVA
jgi:hypothetical protein